jgi:tetratricopeptide (TPR) repeat protein
MNIFKFLIVFLLVHNFFLPAQSSQKNALNELFNQLKKVNNSKTAQLLEKKIWSIWNEHPNDIKLTEKLELGIELMQYGDYDYALKIFNNILVTDPEWSEAWNKRATVFFLMKKYKKSLYDIEKVLKIESRHFGALSGQAQIYIKLQKYELAIDSLKKAREIHPTIKGNDLIIELEELIKSQSI